MIHNMNVFSLSIQVPVPVLVVHPVLLRQNAYVSQNALQTAYVNKNWLFTHFDDIIYDNRKTWNDVVLTP